jgi:hypothetical protein
MLVNKVVWFLIGAVFFLSPWYYFSSGGFQFVDIFIVAMMFVLYISARNVVWVLLKEDIYKIYISIFVVSVLFFLLNFIVSSQESIFTLIGQNIYFVFLFSTFLGMFSFVFYQDQQLFLQRLQYLLLLSFLIPFAAFFMFRGYLFGGRFLLSFNNPNQLGFFALTSISISFYILLLAKKFGVKLNKTSSLTIINVCLFFFILSVTRAAVGILIIYMLSYSLIFKIDYRLKKNILLLFLFFAIVVLGVLLLGKFFMGYLSIARGAAGAEQNPQIVQDIYTRAYAGIGENITNFWYLFFGSGQDSRLDGVEKILEYHNNFVNIFSESGVIVLLLYLYFNLVILKKLYRCGGLYLLPYVCYIFYSLFQFTLRTRMNWLFLAFTVLVIFIARPPKKLRAVRSKFL